MFTKYRLLGLTMVMAIVTVIAIAACSPAEPQVVTEQVEVTRVVTEQVEVEKEVEKVVTEQVEVTRVVTEQVEVEKEVEVEKVVTEQVEVTRVVEVMAPEGTERNHRIW